MKTQHTPGPWEVAEDDASIVSADFERLILTLDARCMHNAPLEEIQANARLIAAAPDLLAALETIAAQGGPFAERQPALDYATIGNLARAAIAKATGETS